MVIMRDQYILGNIRELRDAILDIGRFYTLDSSLGSNIAIDVSKPHVILISGKRGYGKSYTMGVLIEELSNLKQKNHWNNINIIIIDTLGIFWTLAIPNNREEKLLDSWGLKTKTFNPTIYTSQNNIPFYKSLGINVKTLILKPSQFSIDQWYHIFNIKPTDPFGMALTKAILTLDSNFDLSDIKEWIQNTDIGNHTMGVAENFISLAESWNIFSKNGLEINDLLRDNIVIIDLSGISDNNLKTGVTSFIGDKIFDIQIEKRKQYELYQIGKIDYKPDISLVWFAIDEAQLFIPRNENKLGRKIFIEKWLRQGRQPGLSMILATQHPSLIDQEVLSHCDIILCHKLTSQNDIDSLSKLRPTYMAEEIKDSMKKIGNERGVALVIDDISESTHIIKIRPRHSWHGGGEPSILKGRDEIIEETR